MLGAALSWARAHSGKVLGVGGSFVGIGAAYAWNGSEQWRMARAIRNGQFRPEKPASFQDDFCGFDLNRVRSGLEGNGIVCLIGLKATGKTTTVMHLLHEATNPFFLKISHDDVHAAIYNKLCYDVWRLPWLLNGLRVDAGKPPETIVTEVFKKVQDMTGKPVHLGFDVVEEAKQNPVQDSRAIDALRAIQNEPCLQVPTSFDAKLFVKRVKYLCADRHVAKAVFSTSEGLQVMAVDEPRLEKFMGQELDIDKAKGYLKHLYPNGNYSEDLLGRIPRTFEKLQKFAKATDKEVFCEEEMDGTKAGIEKSKNKITDAKGLYGKAVQQGTIGIVDVMKHCKTEEHFVDVLVRTNIFGPAPGRKWHLQFDCTVAAAKEVFGL